MIFYLKYTHTDTHINNNNTKKIFLSDFKMIKDEKYHDDEYRKYDVTNYGKIIEYMLHQSTPNQRKKKIMKSPYNIFQ